MTADPRTCKTQFHAGVIGKVWFDEATQRWCWSVLDNNGAAESASEALDTAQAFLISTVSLTTTLMGRA